MNGILGVFLILSDFLLSPGDTGDLLSFIRNSPLILHMWCLLMGFGATRFVVFISSDHLLLLVFIFGNFCKMICEGIMLAIVMHPFDIGDHCIIDKEQLVIEKIGLISTVFLKDNNRKVECLNSVLLTKFISNLNRSSELADSFDILVSSTTCLDTTAALKLKIEEISPTVLKHSSNSRKQAQAISCNVLRKIWIVCKENLPLGNGCL